MSLPARLLFLAVAALNLVSCGTASHLLGQAGGLVNSITSPVLGAIRLSDSPDTPAPAPPPAREWRTRSSAAVPNDSQLHDSRPTPAKRPH